MDKNTDKKSAKQTKQELVERINELALETRAWALKNACYKDEESNEVLGYFVVERRSKKSPKPVWLEHFSDENQGIWDFVKLRMLELGIPLTMDSRNGHYIGLAGDQGGLVGTQFNHGLSRFKTLRKYCEAIILSHEWDKSGDARNSRLPDEYKGIPFLQVMQAVDHLFLVTGQPVQLSLAEYLLATMTEETDE